MKRSSKAGGRAGKAWRRTAATQARPNPPKAASGRRPATTTQETEIARLTREHDEALEREKASAEVLRVIGSSPGDPRPVFEAVLENAARICEAKFGNLLLYDGASFRVAAIRGAVPAFEDLRRRNPTFQIDSTSPLGRLVTTKQVQHIIDLKLDPAYAARATTMVTLVDVAGARTFLAVPMLKESQLLGVFAIYRQEVRAFTDRQIELVQNFAAQTVIAIENARLLNELRQRTTDLTESLEQQTATAEVLEVISGSPGELEPTFKAVLESAARICEARNALIFLRDGDVAVTRAQFGPMEGTPIGYRTPPLNRDLVVGRAILDARIINVTDLANSDDFPLGRELARRYGHSLRGVTLSAVVAFFEKLPPCLVGMEACASSHHWSRELQKLGHPVRLMLREAPTSDAT